MLIIYNVIRSDILFDYFDTRLLFEGETVLHEVWGEVLTERPVEV